HTKPEQPTGNRQRKIQVTPVRAIAVEGAARGQGVPNAIDPSVRGTGALFSLPLSPRSRLRRKSTPSCPGWANYSKEEGLVMKKLLVFVTVVFAFSLRVSLEQRVGSGSRSPGPITISN